jgi:hypothetical protein
MTFFISSTILLLFTYRKYRIGNASSMFALHQKPGSSSRDITIKLHPENYNRRAATTIVHYWNITKGYRSPDGVQKKLYLINGLVSTSNTYFSY